MNISADSSVRFANDSCSFIHTHIRRGNIPVAKLCNTQDLPSSMPRELPHPATKPPPGSSAGRCTTRQAITDQKLNQQDERPADALLASSNWILPVPTILGPFGFTSAFKRISAHLKPFVRLPLHPETESEPSAQAHGQHRRRASSLPAREIEQVYTYTSFDDLAPLAPAPWTPVGPVPPMKVARTGSPQRSDTMDTTSTKSSSTTHHMTMLAMYRTGQLNSRYTQVNSSSLTHADSKVSKKRRTRQHARRRSTYRHSIPNTRPPGRDITSFNRPASSRAPRSASNSTVSTSIASTSSSATRGIWSDTRSRNSSSTTLHSKASSYHTTKSCKSMPPVSPKIAPRLHFHRTPVVAMRVSISTSIDTPVAEARMTYPVPTARSALQASLQKYARQPSPPSSSPPSLPPRPKSPFMFPHERNHIHQQPFPSRNDTVSTISTMSTYGSHLTDSLAVRYRASQNVVKVFVNGHWMWLPSREDQQQQPPRRRQMLWDEVADDGEDVAATEWWRGWWQGGGSSGRWW